MGLPTVTPAFAERTDRGRQWPKQRDRGRKTIYICCARTLPCIYSSSKTNDWTETSKGTTKSYLTIDLINQTHDFYALETETIERQQFNVVNNVQFEKCPNNYTRVSIFYSQKETAAEALRYTRISWYAATIETSAKRIYTNLRD